MRRPLIAASVAMSLALLAAGPAQAGPPPAGSPGAAPRLGGTVAAYSLVVPSSVSPSGILTRVVLPRGVRCPDLTAMVSAGSGSRTVVRHSVRRRISRTTGSAFTAVAVCEVRMPSGATAASIGGTEVPASLPDHVRTIAMTGDTGCRIWGSTIQDCTDPAAWPLARISQSLADDHPDLTIYLGDVFYREAACPTPALCANSPAPIPGLPFEDSDYGWIADALLPMAPMFAAAPVLAVRGNHELCYRGGNGWFLFLDPSWQNGSACAPDAQGNVPTVNSPTFAVDLPVSQGRALRLVTVDSSSGRDDTVSSAQSMLRPLYDDADRLAQGATESWLLTHRPITGLVTTSFAPTPLNGWTPWTSLDQQAASYGLLSHYALMVGSHDHVVQSVQVPGLPGQLVLGNGGTLLDPATGYAIPEYGPLANASGDPVAPDLTPYPRATSEWTSAAFGYAIATPANSDSWRLSLRDTDGHQTHTCRVASGTIACG